MRFTFPAYKKIPANAEEYIEQLEHVKREVDEAIEALNDYGIDSDEFIIELLDITHANETNLRSFDKDTLDSARDKVVQKNRERAYYAQ